MIRALHRILAILAVCVMFYLGGTGTLMQVIDLAALARHAPSIDADMQSINEGRYGNGDIQVITDADLTARPLPAGLDYAHAFEVTLAASHKIAPNLAPRFVEVRQVGEMTVGQVKLGKDVKAFDISTGAPAAPVGVKPLSLAHSLRQSLKELHRFWDHKDVPGVWYELASGLVLWILLLSGLWMYFQLLLGRRKLGRNGFFWMTGGTWKALHRVISVASAICVVMVAFTGTWLGVESVSHSLTFKRGPPVDVSAPLSDDEVRTMAAATLADFRKFEPETPIKTLRVRVYGGMKQGGVVVGTDTVRQILFNTSTGAVASLTEPGYPSSGFPWGTQTHENIKHLHSGMLFGLPTRLMNLIAGLALLYLCVSGVVMYVDMWLRRRKAGKSGIVWI